MPSVLFVCTANRFRSPLAAGWFQHRLNPEPYAQDWSVASAGTWADPGQAAIPSASWAREHFGLDLSAHKSQRINRDLLARYDLILVMENNHREALLVEFPETKGHLFLLSEVAVGLTYDVYDFGIQSDDTFRDIALELHDLIEKGHAGISRLARQLDNRKEV